MRYAIPRRARHQHGVTVVIPCYRYGRYLPAAVGAALAQKHVHTEVVIVDDKSPDDSLEVARTLANADSRVRVIAHEENRGHIRTYNDGLADVRTEFVTLVSADDLVAPGSLDRAVALMEQFPRVGLVYGKVARITEGQPPYSPERGVGLWKVMSGAPWVDSIAKRGVNPIISPEAVLRTEAVRRAGGYDSVLPHSADLEYWLRIAADWDVAQIRGVIAAYYRVHGANMHLTTFSDAFDDIAQKMEAFRRFADAKRAHNSAWTLSVERQAAATLSAEALANANRLIDEGFRTDAQRFADLAVQIALDEASKARAHAIQVLLQNS